MSIPGNFLRDNSFMKPDPKPMKDDLVCENTCILENGEKFITKLFETKLSPLFGEETIELHNEYLELQNKIVKDKVHETRSPENTNIIMRVKEIKAELKKRGYFK